MMSEHLGLVKGNEVIFDNPGLWEKGKNRFEGKGVKIIIKSRFNARNTDQNARHWARLTWLIESGIVQEWGYATKEELHDAFLSAFLTDRTGKLPKVRRSSTLDKKEFSDWEEQIDRYLAGEGIVIPEPDPTPERI